MSRIPEDIMSRVFTVGIVGGIFVTVCGLAGVLPGVMLRSSSLIAADLVGAVGGLGMATFGLIGKKQLPPRP